MKTNAAILVSLRRPLVLGEIETPHLSRGQVLVRIHCSGVCGSQIGEIEGVKGPDPYLPHLLGHEGSGVVLETGPEVKGVHNGDHVVLHWRKGPGIESEAPRYRWGDRIVNAGWVTTFNAHAVVSENRLTPIPEDVDFAVAALLGCAVTTGLGVVHNDAKVRKGESVLVLGCGGVGLSEIQGAALAGANPILAVDTRKDRLLLAHELGATHTLSAQGGKLKREIVRITGGKGVDVALENTGLADLIELAWETAAPRGRTVLVGVPRWDRKASIDTLPLHFGKVLTGSHGGASQPAQDIPRCIELFKSGQLELRKLIGPAFKLEEINKAIRTLKSGRGGRVLIFP